MAVVSSSISTMTSLSPLLRLLLIAAAASAVAAVGDGCSVGCDLAAAVYYIEPNQNLSYIANLFGINDYRTLQPYNPRFYNLDFIPAGENVVVNFPCRCHALPGPPFSTYLAGSFPHMTSQGETYTSIAATYNNLTTAAWLQATNSYKANSSLDPGMVVNVTVNCSCGDPVVSAGLRLFLTYPLRDGETLDSVAEKSGMVQSDKDLLRSYNPGIDGVTGSRLVYIPLRGEDNVSFLMLQAGADPDQKRYWCHLHSIVPSTQVISTNRKILNSIGVT